MYASKSGNKLVSASEIPCKTFIIFVNFTSKLMAQVFYNNKHCHVMAHFGHTSQVSGNQELLIFSLGL